MDKIEELSIDVAADVAAELRAAAEAGGYVSLSEVIRDALRDWRLRRQDEALDIEEMRRLVQEGIDSGPGIDAKLVFAELRARYAPPDSR